MSVCVPATGAIAAAGLVALASSPICAWAQVAEISVADTTSSQAPASEKPVDAQSSLDALNKPDDTKQELASPQPQPRGVVFPGLDLPLGSENSAFKKWLLDNHGITYALSYQQLSQYATRRLPNKDPHWAVGGWAGSSLTWTMLDRGGPFEGTFVVSGGWRGPVGQNPWPAPFGPANLGMSWSSYTFTSWRSRYQIENLYWDQKIGNDLILRFGNQAPQAVLNTFRFKNGATQFTGSPAEFSETIPYPTFGAGASFRWRPSAYPGFYVNGDVNSMNGNPGQGSLNWKDLKWSQLFVGVEVGKQWLRENGEYDQLSLLVFHAGTRSILKPEGPNSAGGGFKILAEKQIGQFVLFANYIYNTAKGGGISTTFSGNTAVAGVALLRPFDIRGEIAFAGMWTKPFRDIQSGSGQRIQYGIETYWNMALTESVSLTPGTQLIQHPSFNPRVSFLAIPSIKFKVSY